MNKATDVWEMFCAAKKGDVETLKALLEKDDSLVRGEFDSYCKWRLPGYPGQKAWDIMKLY